MLTSCLLQGRLSLVHVLHLAQRSRTTPSNVLGPAKYVKVNVIKPCIARCYVSEFDSEPLLMKPTPFNKSCLAVPVPLL